MTPKKTIIALAVVAMAIIPLFAIAGFSLGALLNYASFAAVGVGMALINANLVQDYSTRVTKTLPASNTVAYSAGLDLGHTTNGRVPPGTEVRIKAPALAVGELSDAATMIYKLQMDTDAAFGSPTDFYGAVLLTQTGAGGVGAAAAEKRVALPSDCERYIRLAATANTNLDASAKSMEFNVLFPAA